jgi:lipoprotein-anchoring transpeptidase ErfK/SrfK
VVLEPGKELVVDGRIVVPPTGVIERQYPHTLGTRRLYLGDGYGIHGTTDPGSIGRAATHGCIRMRNRQIEALWPLVPTRTPVIIL